MTAFVREVCTDPVARRALRRQPNEALRDHGFSAPQVTGELPVRHHTVSVLIDELTLFGRQMAAPTLDEPVELTLVVAGAKSMALLHDTEERAAAVVSWAEARRLAAVLGPFEFDVTAEAGKGSFVDVAVDRRPARPGSGAWRSVLVARSHNDVMLGWLSLLFGWDELLGRLLGYPPCCVDAFSERWRTALRDHGGDPAGAHLSSGPWELNVAARFLGPVLVQHFPCRADCEQSLTVARRNLATLRALRPEAAAWAERVLPAPLLHAGREGVVALVGACVQADHGGAAAIVEYAPEDMLCSGDTPTTRRLRRGGQLTVDDRGSVALEGEEMPGRLVTFTGREHALVGTA